MTMWSADADTFESHRVRRPGRLKIETSIANGTLSLLAWALLMRLIF